MTIRFTLLTEEYPHPIRTIKNWWMTIRKAVENQPALLILIAAIMVFFYFWLIGGTGD